MNRFYTDDIQKLSRVTGLSREEARRLLRHTGGDYRRALRLHQEAFSLFLEPERVEDDPSPVKTRLSRALNALPVGLRRALIPCAAALAMCLAPRACIAALLLILTLRLIAKKRRACAGAAA